MAALQRENHLPAAVLKDGEPDAQTRKQVAAYRDARRRLLRRPYSKNKARFAELKWFTKARFRQEYAEQGILPDPAIMAKVIRLACHHADELSVREWMRADWPCVLSDDELTKIIDAAYRRRRKWSPDQVADELGIFREERDALGLVRIGAIDFRKEDRDEARRQKDRDRKRATRALARQDRPATIAEARPWETAGVSRRTWFRRLAEARGTDDGTTFGTKSVRSTSLYNIADAESATISASAAKAKRPSIEAGKPWEAEGISRRTWFRRQQAARDGNSKAPRPIRSKAIKKPKANPLAASASNIVMLQDDARAVAARVASISRHLETTARPLLALVRATSSFPLTNWRPNHAAHS